MDPTHFDALVQSLARFGSRRRLLTGLAGGLLAPLVAASTSEAKRRHSHRHPHGHAQKDGSASHGEGNGGNSACAHFCQALFAPGPDRGQCVSEAAQGRGLCATCGDDVSAVCCAKTNGYCSSYATARCCEGCTPSCAGKQCGDDGCGGICGCPTREEACINGHCVNPCASDTNFCQDGTTCGPNASCLCLQSVSGVSYCASEIASNVSCQDCTSNDECPFDHVCTIMEPKGPTGNCGCSTRTACILPCGFTLPPAGGSTG